MIWKFWSSVNAILASEEIPQRLRKHPEASADATKKIQQVAKQWSNLPIIEKQQYLETAQLEVRIGDSEMVVSAHPEQIGMQHLYPLGEHDRRKIDNAPLNRTVPIHVKVVNEKHLIELADGVVDKAKDLQRTQLLQRTALGRVWIEQLVQGEMQSMKALADREKKTDSYIYDVLRAGMPLTHPRPRHHQKRIAMHTAGGFAETIAIFVE